MHFRGSSNLATGAQSCWGPLKDGVEHNLVSAQPRGKQAGVSIYQLSIHLWLNLATRENNSRAFLSCFICKVSLFSEKKKKALSPRVTGVSLQVRRWMLSECRSGQMKLADQPQQWWDSSIQSHTSNVGKARKGAGRYLDTVK